MFEFYFNAGNICQLKKPYLTFFINLSLELLYMCTFYVRPYGYSELAVQSSVLLHVYNFISSYCIAFLC